MALQNPFERPAAQSIPRPQTNAPGPTPAGTPIAKPSSTSFVPQPGVNTAAPGRPSSATKNTNATANANFFSGGTDGGGIFDSGAPAPAAGTPAPAAGQPAAPAPAQAPAPAAPVPAAGPVSGAGIPGGFNAPAVPEGYDERRGEPEPLPGPNPYARGTKEYRQYEAQKQQVKERNYMRGFSLEQMGKFNVHEQGQSSHSFEKLMDAYGPAVDPNWTYDIAAGMRVNRATQDTSAHNRWEPIPPNELREIQEWMKWRDSPEGQDWANAYGGSAYRASLRRKAIQKAVSAGHMVPLPGGGGYVDFAGVGAGGTPQVAAWYDQYGRQIQGPPQGFDPSKLGGIYNQAYAGKAGFGTASTTGAPTGGAQQPQTGQQPVTGNNSTDQQPGYRVHDPGTGGVIMPAVGGVPVPPAAGAGVQAQPAPQAQQPQAPQPAAATPTTTPAAQSAPTAVQGTPNAGDGQAGVPAPSPATSTAPAAAPPTGGAGAAPVPGAQAPAAAPGGPPNEEAGPLPLPPPPPMPSQQQLDTLPEGGVVASPYGNISRDQEGLSLILNEVGAAVHTQQRARLEKEFGSRPFAGDPHAPSPPIRVGAWNYNPFRGRFAR